MTRTRAGAARTPAGHKAAPTLSTAGLRKRAHELYPAPAFLEMALQAGAPVALSSDAHRPEEVGADYDRALDLLEALGVGELCVFDRRERRLRALSRSGAPGAGADGPLAASSERAGEARPGG